MLCLVSTLSDAGLMLPLAGVGPHKLPELWATLLHPRGLQPLKSISCVAQAYGNRQQWDPLWLGHKAYLAPGCDLLPNAREEQGSCSIELHGFFP